jgi:hypothetical protein
MRLSSLNASTSRHIHDRRLTALCPQSVALDAETAGIVSVPAIFNSTI